MPRIGVIAPYAQIGQQAMEAARELGIAHDIAVRVASAREVVEVAEEILAAGVEVLVSRGNSADILRRSDIPAPVVTVTLTCRDMYNHLLEAQKLTGLAKPRIAIVAVHIMNQEVEFFVETLGIDLKVYESTYEIVDQTLQEIMRDGMDVVVGGEITTGKAKKLGITAFPLLSSVEAMKLFLADAQKILTAMAMEQDRTRRFETLVKNLREGVLYADAGGRIRVANPAAEAMLERRAEELCGALLADVPSLSGLSGCLADNADVVEEILTIGGATVMVTVAPAHVGESPSGVIVSLNETNRISRMDGKIRENLHIRGLAAPYRFRDIRGASSVIREAKRLATEYAAAGSTVLIFGETGAGKELFAQSIHNASRYAAGPFVAVNCAALPSALLESELFGYEEGAFTGANRRGKTGLIELAHTGTLFLDEISEMDRHSQVRLLRFLQERQIMRVGGDRYIPILTRVIAATNRDLGAMVADREFREDLYYRLKVLTLNVPPLREREGDVAHLVGEMAADWEKRLGRKIRMSREVMPILERHDWPGNVRELANVMENLAVTNRRLITGDMVRRMLLANVGHKPRPAPVAPSLDKGAKPERCDDERQSIVDALSAAAGNQSRAARLLGIHRATLHRRMQLHGITFEGLLNAARGGS